MKVRYKIFTVASATLMALSLAGCGSHKSASNNSSNATTTTQVANAKASSLAKLNYKSGKPSYININHDKSTLSPKSWKYDHVIYTNLDHENRTSKGNTGYLDSKNVANDSLRTRQIVKPTGWHQKFINREAIINRGHEIAYSLSKGISKSGKYSPSAESGDQNNPKNLFTQTAFSNQKVQTIYESKVRNALRDGYKVIYQVQPIFQGKDLMAKGVHMQAISTNKKLNFNVYSYNVQPGMKFNYANGRSSVDHAMKVPTPKNTPSFNNGRKYRKRSHHYIRHTAEGYGAYRLARHHYRRRSYYPRRHYRRHSYIRHYRKPAYEYKRHYRREYREY